MNKVLRTIVVILVSVALVGAWISSADASGEGTTRIFTQIHRFVFVSPVEVEIMVGPVPGAKDLDPESWHEAARVEKPTGLSGLACVIAARAWFVDESVCR